jgi:hypothetical protein
MFVIQGQNLKNSIATSLTVCLLVCLPFASSVFADSLPREFDPFFLSVSIFSPPPSQMQQLRDWDDLLFGVKQRAMVQAQTEEDKRSTAAGEELLNQRVTVVKAEKDDVMVAEGAGDVTCG